MFEKDVSAQKKFNLKHLQLANLVRLLKLLNSNFWGGMQIQKISCLEKSVFYAKIIFKFRVSQNLCYGGLLDETDLCLFFLLNSFGNAMSQHINIEFLKIVLLRLARQNSAKCSSCWLNEKAKGWAPLKKKQYVQEAMLFSGMEKFQMRMSAKMFVLDTRLAAGSLKTRQK